jgi:CspA family cold shock protein
MQEKKEWSIISRFKKYIKMIGIIKKVVTDKGFGFLSVEGREKDLFFHASGVVNGPTEFNTMQEGDKVTFKDIVNNGKGDAATGVEFA